MVRVFALSCARLASMAWLVVSLAIGRAADPLDYSVADQDLKTVLIDSDPHESFLGMHVDTAGRLFVGGREALFVYEPDAQSGFGRRKELFRFPDHTWIYDIAARGNDLYVLTVSALYVIPEAVTKREGLVPKRLIWGVPLGHVHQCFHGMAIGPEGDIYFAMGDPVWYYGDFNRPDHWGHWTFFSQPDGTRTPYTGVGGVFRCRPDGSQLQIVARGLRNSCGLTFDSHWNLFTNDNDHEGLPSAFVPGRLIHVTPHTYFSWPTGWLLSKTPDRADLLETMFDGLGRAVPVGETYYGDTFLPERLQDNLLIARWCIRAVTRYPLEHRGASFKVHEQTLMSGQDLARPVSVAVGRGGRIFVTVSYMAHNEGSPVYRSDVAMITRRDNAPPYPFAGYEATSAAADRLWQELSSPSWSDRYRAHVELLRRGGDLLVQAGARLQRAGKDDPAREHLIWLAAAAAPSASPDAARRLGQRLGELARHGDDMQRLQAVRALTEFRALQATVDLLDDPNPQVQHACLLSCFDRDFESVATAVISGPARSRDTYLRQAAALLLAEKAPLDRLAELCDSDESRTRLAGVLAAGFRLTLPPATAEIPERLSLDEPRGPEIDFAEGKVDLRTLGRIGTFTVADHWKQGGHTPEQERLFALLLDRLSDADEQIRLQSAHFLYLLADPRSEPLVAKVRNDNDDRRLATAPLKTAPKLWVAGPFADGEEGFRRVHPPETGPIELAAKYSSPAGPIVWQETASERLFDFRKLYGKTDHASFYAYFRLESGSRQRINLLLGSDDGIKVWHNGRETWCNDVSRAALPLQDVLALELEPGSNDFLVRVRNTTGESGLFVHYRSLQALEFVLPEKIGLESLTERLKAAAGNSTAAVPPEFLSVDWGNAVLEGNVEQGRKLFEAIGCVKCHAVKADAALTGGPSLADAAKRFTVAYLVESVLLPSKQVSPVFRATAVVTKDGLQLSGLVVGETADKIELLQTDAKRVTIAKTEIESRQTQDLSPMPQGVVKRPDELRDLLAYLLAP